MKVVLSRADCVEEHGRLFPRRIHLSLTNILNEAGEWAAFFGNTRDMIYPNGNDCDTWFQKNWKP